MRCKTPTFLATLLALTVASAASGPARLADVRAVEGAGDLRLEKVLVVGISDDRDVRNRFEDRFASHFRGRGITATASHSLVPDLTRIEDREKILAMLLDERVDAVMTVRAVGVGRGGEEAWIESWERWTETGSTVRRLIEDTLPIEGKPDKRLGVELAFWDLRGPRRLWAARSDVLTRKQLDRAANELLQATIASLRDHRWL